MHSKIEDPAKKQRKLAYDRSLKTKVQEKIAFFREWGFKVYYGRYVGAIEFSPREAAKLISTLKLMRRYEDMLSKQSQAPTGE